MGLWVVRYLNIRPNTGGVGLQPKRFGPSRVCSRVRPGRCPWRPGMLSGSQRVFPGQHMSSRGAAKFQAVWRRFEGLSECRLPQVGQGCRDSAGGHQYTLTLHRRGWAAITARPRTVLRSQEELVHRRRICRVRGGHHRYWTHLKHWWAIGGSETEGVTERLRFSEEN